MAVRTNFDKYARILEDLPDGVVVVDHEGVAKFANSSAIQMFGGEPSFIINQKIGLPLDYDHSLELDLLTQSNGHPIIAEIKLAKTEWEGSEAFVACLRDVTAKREQQEVIETVFQAFTVLQEGFFICNSEGKIIYANPAFEKITGYNRKEILGKTPAFLKSGVHNEEFYAEFYKKLANEGEWHGIIWNRRANGQIYPEKLHVTTVLTETGGVKYYVALFSDATDVYYKEEELRKSRDQAIQAEKKKSEFLSRASHEIRAPMSGIIGYSELLAETNLTTEQREYLEVIRSSAKSLLNLINEVLDISRLQSGRTLSKISVFSLRELMQELHRFFKVHTLKKDIVLGYYFSDKIPDWLEGEKEPLRQVLTNLLSNAFKFTRYGKINFGVDKVEDLGEEVLIHFTVSDTGIGIEPEHLEKVFEPFYQVESIMQDQYAGSSSGLGLTIVKAIVEKNGGKVQIESIHGEGTKVHFSFKARKTGKVGQTAQMIKENEERLEKWKNRGRSLSVLLAEDNYPNQMYIKRILEKRSIFVTVASNGDQVLERLKEKDFDVILMDIRMPKMDGLEATRRIRAMSDPKKSRIPIIALTGLTSEEERTICQEAGMDGFLVKPVEIDLLIYEILRFVFP